MACVHFLWDTAVVGAVKKMPGLVSRRVAENLRDLRMRQGVSSYEMARRLRVIGWPIQASGITRIETGQRRVDVDDLLALAIVLNCSPNRLLMPPVLTVSGDGVRGGVGVVTRDTVADGAGAVWRWAQGECPLQLKDAYGDRYGVPFSAPLSGEGLAEWQLQNSPDRFPEVLAALDGVRAALHGAMASAGDGDGRVREP